VCLEATGDEACGLAGVACVRCRGAARCEALGACREPPVPDAGVEPSLSCEAPGELDVTDGGLRLLLAMAGAGNDGASSCGGADGPDRVWRLTAPPTGWLLVRVAPVGPGRAPTLSLSARTACDGGELPGTCASAPGGAAALLLPSTLAQGALLWLDTLGPDGGEVMLEASAVAADAGGAGAPLLAVSAGVTALALPEPGVVGLEVPKEGSLTLTVDTRASAAPVKVTLTQGYLGTELGRFTLPPGRRALDFGLVPAGRYLLELVGAGAQVDVQLSGDPLGESCRVPAPLALDAGVRSADDSTLGAADDEQPSCAAPGAPDRVHRFLLEAVQNVRVTVAPADATYQPVVLLRRGGCGGAVVACAVAPGPGAAAVLQLGQLAAGEYQVVVDGLDARGGPYRVMVETATPGKAEGCPGLNLAAALSDGGVAVIEGDTRMGSNTEWAACLEQAANNDTYYFYGGYSAPPATVRAVVEPLSSGFLPAVYVNPTCSPGLRQPLRCGTPLGAGEEVTLNQVYQGFFTVGGHQGTTGAYRLTLTSGPVPPADACTSLVTLDAGTDTLVDLAPLHQDFVASCAAPGNDAVFAFPLPAQRRATLRANALPDAGTAVALALRQLYTASGPEHCFSSPTELRCAAGTDAAQLSFPNFGAASLPLVALVSAPGLVNLRLDVSPFEIGDVCPYPGTTQASPLPLEVSADGGVDGGLDLDLSGYFDTNSYLCGRFVSSAARPTGDAQFLFSLPFAATVRVTAAGDGALPPVVQVERPATATQCGGTMVSCDGGVGDGGVAELSVALAAATPYLLTVKAADGTTRVVHLRLTR
jgi:hypothetical protein